MADRSNDSNDGGPFGAGGTWLIRLAAIAAVFIGFSQYEGGLAKKSQIDDLASRIAEIDKSGTRSLDQHRESFRLQLAYLTKHQDEMTTEMRELRKRLRAAENQIRTHDGGK